jgi:two-component sensor histidine kinase
MGDGEKHRQPFLVTMDRLHASSPFITEVVVALVAIFFAVGARLAVDIFVSGVVPFALTFPAIMLAALLAGWRAGLLTILGCQLLVWYFVMPPRGFSLEGPEQAVSLVLTTIAQLVVVAAITAYRSAEQRFAAEREKQLGLLRLAQRELEHRTKNNFQLAASILSIQARQTDNAEAARELLAATDRIYAIAASYRNLRLNPDNLSDVPLHRHLVELADRLGVGLGEQIVLKQDLDPVILSAERAVLIGLIVNEWIANAVKHAYPDRRGTIRLTLRDGSTALTIAVADDGIGGLKDERANEGSSLIDLLARNLNATRETIVENGRTCRLVVPKSD